MISLTCRFQLVGNVEPPCWLIDNRTEIAKVFDVSSSHDIALDTTPLGSSSQEHPSAPIYAGEMQDILGRLTHNHTGSVREIFVLVCNRFASYPSAFGIMFDPGPGFNALPDPDNIPREGCAIFLDAIADRRSQVASSPGTMSPFEAETFFTAVHEIGHVFNLWHVEGGPNFMRSSARSDVAPRVDEGFIDDQHKMLADCSQSEFVRPGGKPYGIRGPYGHPENDVYDRPRNAGSLEMRIDMSKQEFFYFEPVELEIELRLRPGRTRPVAIPDMIDPGYGCFEISVEEPDGQRRLYRSPRHYCPHRNTIEVTTTHPFRRDISVFGDAPGFFFRQSGVHKLRATLRLGASRLVSNVVTVNLLRANDDRRKFEQLHPVLIRPEVARFLYRRLAPLRSRCVSEMVLFASQSRCADVSQDIHYALGRLFETCAARARTKTRQTNLRRRGQHHLELAIKGTRLSRVRRDRAMALLSANDGYIPP